MTKIKFTLLFTVAILALVGCSKSKQELLVGHWECNGEEEGMRFSGIMEYVSNGKSNAMMEMSGNESGVPILFELMGQGTWEINDDELLESIERLTVTRLSVDGNELPPENFPKEMKDALIGVSSGSEIIQLDERVLRVKNAGTQTTCSRK